MRLRPTRSCAGFTLIEVIGVLAVIALLAVAVTASVIRRVDQAALTRERADLNTIAEAYTQSSVRNKTIPGTNANSWAASVASQISMPTIRITTNSRNFSRVFLVDPALSINGSGLGYIQTSNGTTKPLNARVLIASSLDGVPSASFSNFWNLAENDNVLVKKLDVGPLFHRLILIDHDTANAALFSIDATNTMVVPPGGVGWDKYYLDGTEVGLHGSDGSVQTRYTLKRSISFVFEDGAWRGAVEGGQTFNETATEFLNKATLFFNSPVNSGVNQGASQYSVIMTMYTFMFDYTLWANECFYRHGSTSLPPEYELLYLVGGNSQALDKYSGANGILK